jgi:hypothetical protein
MSAIDYADGLLDRAVSFNLFRTSLHQNGLTASQGWERTVDKLADSLGAEKTGAAYAEGLKAIYFDLTLYGNKLVKVFNTDADLEHLCKLMRAGFVDADSVFKKRFPLPLEQDDLVAAPLKALCTGLHEDVDGVSFIICSKQYIVEREALPAESLNDEVIDQYGDFDEIYGIRKRAIQLFDVVAIKPAKGTIEIRMDGLHQQRVEDIEKRLRVIEENTLKFSTDMAGMNNIFAEPLNFFSCIKKLYDSADGRIGELGHSTESAAVHRGKTRGKGEDIRIDKYHAGGVDNIVELNAHMLTKRWDSPTKCGVVELEIPGTLSLLSSLQPTIDIVNILSCASEDDYNFVMLKLFEALK